MIRLFALGLLTTAFFSSPVQAQNRVLTFQYDQCQKHVQSTGGTRDALYVAWNNGLGFTCLKSDSEPAKAHKFILKKCDDALRRTVRHFKIKTRCDMAISQGQVVDARFTRALKDSRPIPVELDIFDGTGRGLQPSSRASIRTVPTKYLGIFPAEFVFTVNSDGVDICKGTIKPAGRASSSRVTYAANCFGIEHSGTAKLEKVVVRDGLYLNPAPSKVRMNHDPTDSWIEIRF